MHSGLLQVSETKHGAFITWDRAGEPGPVADRGRTVVINDAGRVELCVGSPPSADWAVIAESQQGEPVTPLGRVRFQSRGSSSESPAVTFSSHLEERQLALVVEVRVITCTVSYSALHRCLRFGVTDWRTTPTW